MRSVLTSKPSVPAPATGGTTRTPWLIICLAAVYLIWSSTYLAMQIAFRELPPLLMGSFRFLVAGAVLLVIARRRGAPWPSGRDWLGALPSGALLFVGGNGFVAIAELSVPSGGAAVVCATMPLWTGALSALSGDRPSWRDWLSLLMGFVGVLVLMGGPSLAGEPRHIALVVLAPICWALGSILARRKTGARSGSALLSSAVQMIAGAVALALGGAVRGEDLPHHVSAASWLALGYLLVFGSLIGFTAYNWLLRNSRPAIATSYAYVNPALAVLIGAAIADEALGVSTLIANVLIIGAIGLALIRVPARRAS